MGLAGVGPYSDSQETGTDISVHAGFPNPAAERAGNPLSLDRLLIRHPSSTFMFRITGNAWARYGVFDGDIAVLDKAFNPTATDLVVWWDDSGAFNLSRFRDAQPDTIWGVVTAIIHPSRRLRARNDNDRAG